MLLNEQFMWRSKNITEGMDLRGRGVVSLVIIG